jgi:hypothetical protein
VLTIRWARVGRQCVPLQLFLKVKRGSDLDEIKAFLSRRPLPFPCLCISTDCAGSEALLADPFARVIDLIAVGT